MLKKPSKIDKETKKNAETTKIEKRNRKPKAYEKMKTMITKKKTQKSRMKQFKPKNKR